jgi:hypothetical protein
VCGCGRGMHAYPCFWRTRRGGCPCGPSIGLSYRPEGRLRFTLRMLPAKAGAGLDTNSRVADPSNQFAGERFE